MKCSFDISNFLEDTSAAAAKLLRSCLTLCDPTGGSPPGSAVPGILQARTHRTIQKMSNDPDNHNGVVTHLEPDILECGVKWALGNIAMSKASGRDKIPAQLFKNPQR